MTQTPKPVETVYSKVKGTSFYNVPWDKLYPGAILQFARDPQNQYDPNAIALYYQDQQVGHLSKELAAELAPMIDANQLLLLVEIHELTGGGLIEDRPKHRGINIKLELLYSFNALDQFIAP